jgi:hypothetical protein
VNNKVFFFSKTATMKISTTVLQALSIAIALQATSCASEPPKQCNKPMPLISIPDIINIDTVKIENKLKFPHGCPSCGGG